MKIRDLSPKQLISVLCPTCGVAAGKRCQLSLGDPRNEPHLDRKLSAVEAIRKEIKPLRGTEQKTRNRPISSTSS